MQKTETWFSPFFRELKADISFQHCRGTDMLQLSNGKESVYTCKCSILQSYLNKVQISNTYSSQQLEFLDVSNSKCSLLGAFPPSTTDN